MSEISKRRHSLTKKTAIRLSKKALNETDLFLKNQIKKTDDPLSVVIKSHLYVESLLNQIITLVFPVPKPILNKNFSYKIDSLLSLDLFPSTEILRKLQHLNILRNKFAHNYKYKILSKDIEPLLMGVKLNKKISNNLKLRNALAYIVMYLEALKNVYQVLPFSFLLYSFDKVFSRDMTYNKSKITSMLKDKKIDAFLEHLKI